MRRLTGILCTLVTVLLLCPVVVFPQKKPAPALPFTSGELQDIFKSYNRMYWDGKLVNAQVVWTALDNKYGETSQADDGRFTIRLDVIKNREANVAKTTILHEMCHLKTWGDQCHVTGKPDQCRRFYAELHRIMLEGAFDDIL